MDWDDSTLNLKPEINLENMAAVTLASLLWENDDIQEEIISFSGEWKKYDIFRKEEPTWKSITSKVCDLAKTLKLPQELLKKVENIIHALGFQINAWNDYVRQSLRLPFEFGNVIFWTNYGTVNERDIFQIYWRDRFGFKITLYNSDNFMIFLACILAQEVFIRENLEIIKKVTDLRLAPAKFKTDNYSEYGIIAMWLCIYMTGSKKEGVKVYCEAQRSNIISSKLLMMCIENSFPEAAKYFWYKLKVNEAVKFTAYECGKIVLENGRCEYYSCSYLQRYDHERVKRTELLIFFMNKMSEDEKIQFISENLLAIFDMFKYWPFNEILVKILSDNRIIKNVSSDDMCALFIKAAQCITNDSERFIDKDFCNHIIPKLLEKIPKQIKLTQIFTGCYSWFSRQQFSPSMISILSMIFCDKDFADNKIEILESNKHKFKNLIISKNFEELEKFALNVFPLENERKAFKLKMNFLHEFIIKRNFVLANELLDWISDSDEERKKLKDQIDPIDFFCGTANVQFLNEFLLWKYEGEEEKKKAKEFMRQNEFLTVKIIKMWSKDEVDEKDCSDYLQWLMDTDTNQKVDFKQLLIIDENFLRKFWESLYSLKFFKRTDKLIRFFSLTPFEISKIKENLMKNKDEWILTYVVTKKNYKLAEAIFNWVYGDGNQKNEALKKYLNSSDGALLLLKTWMSCGLNYGEAMVFLLDKWVRPFGDLCTIKGNLNSMILNDFWEISARCTLIKLLDNANYYGITTKTLSSYF